MSSQERNNYWKTHLEIEDNFVVPGLFSCVVDLILTATGLFSVASLGLFAPDFLSIIVTKSTVFVMLPGYFFL